jgi:lysophospholipase L1-like esterase
MAPVLFAGPIVSLKDSSGNVVACVHDSGHLVLSGEMKFNCGTITPSASNQILVKDGSTCLARFELDASKVFFPPTSQAPNSPYVLFLKDAEQFLDHPIPSGTYPVAMNTPSDIGIASAFKTSDGSMINYGLVCENRPDPTVFPGGQVFLPGTYGQSNYLANLRIALNRIKNKPSGSNIKLAFVGGSITQAAGTPGTGTKITPTTWYATKVADYMASNGFLPTNGTVTLINAGRGGMGSDAAMCYLASDVVAQSPDLVVVECAANDYLTFNGDQIPVGEARPGTLYRADQRAMEGVLRQLLSMGTPPGVILLGMVYGNSDTKITGAKDVPSSSLRPISCTFQDRHLRVARHYGIPLVSYRDEYWPAALGEADPTMRSFYNYNDPPVDYIHPNGAGHGKMADLITALLNTAKNAPETPSPSYSLPAQIFTNPGSYGTMTEVSANSHPGITVTIGQILVGGNWVDTWGTTSVSVHKFTSLLEPEDYTVTNVWESTGGSGTNDDYWIQFAGIPKSEVIVQYSMDSSNHGTLRAIPNGDTGSKVDINESLGSQTVGWTWVAFSLPNQSNTVKFIAKTSGKHCIIHRLWLTGSY